MENFSSFINPFVGGVIIALSTSLMMVGLGRVTGISGILGSALFSFEKGQPWRYFFLGGLLLGGFLVLLLNDQFFQYSIDASYIDIILAGLFVGFGTRLGGGCTSGHGVCGLPRLSARSIAATLIFMASGIVTVFIGGLL